MKSKSFAHIFAITLISLAASAFAAENAKNVADVRFEPRPADFAGFMKAHPERWNFGFRPYGDGAGDLWTDPQLQRDVTGGKAVADARPTAIAFSMDEQGLTALLFCGEPSLTNGYATGGDFPSPLVEFFICPGDADTEKIRHHYHMYYDGFTLQEFPWLEADRDFRTLLPYTTLREHDLPNGVMLTVTYAWEGMFDFLPFIDAGKKDNFWRFSAIRWASGGGQTWGGKVHAPSQAGYIRFPEFTPEQKTAIMAHVLKEGWKVFRASERDYRYAVGNGLPYADVNTNLYAREERAARPRSFVNYAEEPGFRPELARLRSACSALGPGLARFAEMEGEEQIAFYRKASQLLFNYRYDVEEAYRDYLSRKLEGTLNGEKLPEYACEGADVPSRKVTVRSEADLDKLEAEYAALDGKIAAAKNANEKARLVFRKEQLAFRLAKDDEPEKHLKAMEAAATASGVDPVVMLDLLCDYAQFRRNEWRRFNDAYSFERDALSALEKTAGATNPVARARYYTNAFKLTDSRFGSAWRSDLWNLCEEFSGEHALALAERGLADRIAQSGKAGMAFADEMAGRKGKALVAMARDAEAEKFLLGCLADTNRFSVAASRARLVDFYRETAKRYMSEPDSATLKKALPYADKDAVKFDIALAAKDYALASSFAMTDAQRGDAAFFLGDYAKAAECYAMVEKLAAASKMRHAQALHALGRDAEAISVLEDYQKTARFADKTNAAFYISRLKALLEKSR